uniref:Spondin-like TSP1 domain-containing protein n=1 Tax=Ciona savignyi TaxID=51511 RepID=H2ZLH6_CIOSA
MKIFHCIFVITCLLMLIGSSNAWRRRRRAPPPPPPINCQVGPWTNWGACSVSCGSGIQTRARAITVWPANGGAGCPVTAQSRACNIPPQHCQVSVWSNWGACTASCGAGTQSRSRSVTVNPANCGNACPVLTSSRSCTGTQCPVNCQVSAWTTWSACSVSCGAGTRSRRRSVTVNPQYGGTACPVLTQSENCQVPPINCAVSPWSNWGTCSESCGEGEHSRTRSVTVNPANCGSACPVLQNTRGCSSSLCPIDCQVGSWSSWGGCSASCGSGTYTRTRPITINPVYDGEPCPATTQSDTCNVPQQDCKVSSWSSWGACTASCGCGVQSQTRQITTSTANCGAACPP